MLLLYIKFTHMGQNWPVHDLQGTLMWLFYKIDHLYKNRSQ